MKTFRCTGRRSTSGFILAALMLFAFASISGCARSEQGSAEDEAAGEVPRNVRVLTLAGGDLDEYLEIYGPAAPLRGTVLSAEEAGQVSEIVRDKGVEVGAGDVLVLLDRELLEADMRAMRSSADLAEFNADRTRKLFEENSVSEIDWLNAKTSAAQALAAASAARIRHERAATRAPFGGIVSDRYVELGEMLAPGQPVARVIDPYTLKIEATVSDREIGFLHEGAEAMIELEGSEETLIGRLSWVGLEADPMTGKFKVEIQFDNPDLKLRPGIIVHARVLKRSHRNIIRIPRDAIVQQVSGPVAYVEIGGHARVRPLELGADQGIMVIVESGLAAGDRLLVRGQRDVRDGSLIEVQEATQSPDGSIATDPVVIMSREIEDGRGEETTR